MSVKKIENIGVFFILASAILWGIFPILVNRGGQNIPPVTFAALATILASVGALIYAFFQGKFKELKKKNAYYSLILIAFCIVIIPYSLFFIGSSKTSGINSSILLLTEIIFTLIFTPFVGEKTTAFKIVGALGVLIGAALILYNGFFRLNIGDFLIIASTITYPLGNYYSKKALNLVSPSIILFTRFLFGGIFILLISFFIEPQTKIFHTFIEHWFLILFTGFILLGVSKIFWYEGLKRLDISKAISLIMTFPLFSLIVLVGFFDVRLTIFQWLGIIIMGIGIYFTVKRSSIDPKLTKYAS